MTRLYPSTAQHPTFESRVRTYAGPCIAGVRTYRVDQCMSGSELVAALVHVSQLGQLTAERSEKRAFISHNYRDVVQSTAVWA